MATQGLSHIIRPLPNGGFVLVLNTEAHIGPEAEAMLQALHSRSIGGIRSHLEVLEAKGPEKFMSTFYVGYGHKSIGDCGSCSIFIEGVSMLAAKAIQDWPLYSGQEASTRYIDFASQPFIDPIGTHESLTALKNLRHFYLRGLGVLLPALKERYPYNFDEKETDYEKAIKARSFDIMRGFLPAGAATNLAWHSNLRQIADKLMELRHHSLQEVREIATAIESAVLEAFPNSFSEKRYEATETYNQAQMGSYYFTDDTPLNFGVTKDSVDRGLLVEYRETMTQRPAKTELPKRLAECGTLQFEFLLDFGSFRDIQRQRSVTQRMPLVVTDHWMHPWYLEQLPAKFRAEAEVFLTNHVEVLNKLPGTAEEKQYLIPMGFQLPNRLTGGLPALVYIVELRATRFVHPTLRVRAQQMGQALLKRFKGYGLVLHFDESEDRFDVGRGKHDIVAKETV